MKKVILKSILTAVLCSTASFLVAATVVPAMGGTLDGIGLMLSIYCPLILAGPASGYTFWQRDRLKKVYEALEDAHRQLAGTHAELLEKSRRDFQTGFLNRESFMLELDRRRFDSGALLLLDADHFKAVNDRFGHLVGDEALREIAAAIARAVRANDIVGRIGGEEFGIIATAENPEEALKTGERVRREVERVKFRPDQGLCIPLTISVGGTKLDGASVSDHMRAADLRLYAAKNAGRNRSILEGDARAAA